MNIGCGANIGDCIWVALMLSKLPGEHTFFVRPELVPAMNSLLHHTSIAIRPVSEMPDKTEDGWIANGRWAQKDIGYFGQTDIMGYVRTFMDEFCKAEGITGAFDSPNSMLCSFPAITSHCRAMPFDVLVVNCDPLSGQCPQYSRSELDGVLLALRANGHRVLCTNPTAAAPWNEFTLSQIGNLSLRAKCIIGVASGPLFPTFNLWNKDVPRYIFLEPMRLDFGTPRVRHAACAEQMRQQLNEDGWL